VEPPVAPPDDRHDSRRRRVQLPIILLIVALATAGVGVFVLEKGEHTIEGSFPLFDADVGSDCKGSGGYADIRPGAPVAVRNQSGATIATTTLAAMYFAGTGCEYSFSIDVADAEIYRIEVAHRGEVYFSRQEMEANDWTVSLGVGGS
jgi:hypothetical protein